MTRSPTGRQQANRWSARGAGGQFAKGAGRQPFTRPSRARAGAMRARLAGLTVPPLVLDGEPACAGHDPEAWFTEGREVEAIAVCRSCPVIDRCREYALAHDIEHGVWGGLMPGARKRYRRSGVAS